MSKKIKVSQKDLDDFLEAVKGTRPLEKEPRIHLDNLLKGIRPKRYSEREEGIQLSEKQDLPCLLSDEFISYKRSEVSNKILRKLQKGQYNIEAILDLHGLSVEGSAEAVVKFLQECVRKEIHVALIIHGKGHHSQMPILKNKLNHWLREIDAVRAFCSAAPAQGGHGAMYVLLKHAPEENSFE